MAFSKNRRLADFIAADGTIPTGKFASGTITSAHIADTAITHADLHTDMNLTSKTVLVANASTGDSDTTAANTAFVQQEIAALVDSSPSTLNTLNELAAALGDDANFSTTTTNAIATKLPLAGGTMTGNIAHASDFTIDVGGDINLDADGGDVNLKDGGTAMARFGLENGDLNIAAIRQDYDIRFKGMDGNTTPFTALHLDMSDAGAAIFSGAITSGSHLINSSSSAFGSNSVQGFNTDFLVDTGQGYSRHNSYHTGGSNHQFIVNAAGSTTNTIALAISKDANATFAGTVLASNGTASLPSLSFSGDSNTGIYRSGSDNLGFAIGGQARAFMSANQFNMTGNGIFSGNGSFGGTLTTGATSITSSTNMLLTLNPTAGNYGGILYKYGGATKGSSIYNSGMMVYGGESGVSTSLQAGGQYGLFINHSTRWVGIGMANATPTSVLNVRGDGGAAGLTFKTEDASANETFYVLDGGRAGLNYYPFTIGVPSSTAAASGVRLQVNSTTGTTFKVMSAETSAIAQTRGGHSVGRGNQGETDNIGCRVVGWYNANAHSSNSYLHLVTSLWGGGAPAGNSEYIMGGWEITGHQYATNTSHGKCNVFFHNWSGTVASGYSLSYTGAFTGFALVYVNSSGYVTIRLAAGAYKGYWLDLFQAAHYPMRTVKVTAATFSNAATL